MEPTQFDAFESYYNTYYPQVYKYICRKISDPVQAEDLAMDAFVVCLQKFDTFDPQKASFGTWLYVIVNNKLKNFYRDRKPTEELDDAIPLPHTFEDDIVAAAYLGNMRQALYLALQSLPETERKLVIYKHLKNKTADEIAEIMNMTAVNVRVRLSRALKKLKAYFDENNIEWEN